MDKNWFIVYNSDFIFIHAALLEWEGYARKVKSIGFIVKLHFWLFNLTMLYFSVV